MSDFEDLLDDLVPGLGRRTDAPAAEPDVFPRELDLEPLAILSRGEEAVVWRARDPVLDREVAVKIARAEGGAGARERLLAEARLTARLAHPAVVPVHAVRVARGRLAVVLALAPRDTLARWFDARAPLEALRPERRLALLRPVIDAVAQAHALGVVHGDLHPGNLLVDEEGRLRVVDWGGAVPAEDAVFHGEPFHAAPERLGGAPPSPAADVFALAAIAWELLSLRPLRSRHPDEALGEAAARWRREPLPPTPGPLGPWVDRALAGPDERPTAAAWGHALDDLLTGAAADLERSRRAEEHLQRARRAIDHYRELGARLVQERRVVAVQEGRLPGHAPPERKRPLWEARDRVEQLIGQRWLVWMDAVTDATIAGTLADDPSFAEPLVGELWMERLRDSEERGDARFAALSVHRVLGLATAPQRAALLAPARLSLTVAGAPPGTPVRIQRFVQGPRVWATVEVGVELLPLDALALPAGSYLLTVEAPGFVALRYPVLLERQEQHHGEAVLRRPEEVGVGWVGVPAGPFRLGGDPLARRPLEPCRPSLPELLLTRHPITVREYTAFLEDDPGYAHRPEGWTGPTPPEGTWPDWPVTGVRREDAEAYAAWRSRREGRSLRLPTEEEWEKAARGVDGRPFPWGSDADPSFAHQAESLPGAPAIGPVGVFEVDTSVYGLTDLAGGVAEWTGSWLDDEQAVIRGGHFAGDALDGRCAGRAGLAPDQRRPWVGFRLVREP